MQTHTMPTTPAYSSDSKDTRTNPNGNTNILHASLLLAQQNSLGNGSHNTSFSTRPPWQSPLESNLQWTWIEGNGPFITNGQSTWPHFEELDSKSDITTIMFNLGSLNESIPEAM